MQHYVANVERREVQLNSFAGEMDTIFAALYPNWIGISETKASHPFSPSSGRKLHPGDMHAGGSHSSPPLRIWMTERGAHKRCCLIWPLVFPRPLPVRARRVGRCAWRRSRPWVTCSR